MKSRSQLTECCRKAIAPEGAAQKANAQTSWEIASSSEQVGVVERWTEEEDGVGGGIENVLVPTVDLNNMGLSCVVH